MRVRYFIAMAAGVAFALLPSRPVSGQPTPSIPVVVEPSLGTPIQETEAFQKCTSQLKDARIAADMLASLKTLREHVVLQTSAIQQRDAAAAKPGATMPREITEAELKAASAAVETAWTTAVGMLEQEAAQTPSGCNLFTEIRDPATLDSVIAAPGHPTDGTTLLADGPCVLHQTVDLYQTLCTTQRTLDALPEKLRQKTWLGTWEDQPGSRTLRRVQRIVLGLGSNAQADEVARRTCLNGMGQWLERMRVTSSGGWLLNDPDSQVLCAFFRFRNAVSSDSTLWEARESMIAWRVSGHSPAAMLANPNQTVADLAIALGLKSTGDRNGRPIRLESARAWFRYLLLLSAEQDLDEIIQVPSPSKDAVTGTGATLDRSIAAATADVLRDDLTLIRDIKVYPVVEGSIESQQAQLFEVLQDYVAVARPLRMHLRSSQPNETLTDVVTKFDLTRVPEKPPVFSSPENDSEAARLAREANALSAQGWFYANEAKTCQTFLSGWNVQNALRKGPPNATAEYAIPSMSFAEAAEELRRQSYDIRLRSEQYATRFGLVREYHAAYFSLEEVRLRLEVAQRAIDIADQAERIAAMYEQMAEQSVYVADLQKQAESLLTDAAKIDLSLAQQRLDVAEEMLQATKVLAEQYRKVLTAVEEMASKAEATIRDYKAKIFATIDEIKKQNEESSFWGFLKALVSIGGLILAPFTGGQSIVIAAQINQGIDLARSLINADWSNLGTVVANVAQVGAFAASTGVLQLSDFGLDRAGLLQQLESKIPQELLDTSKAIASEWDKLQSAVQQDKLLSGALVVARQFIDLKGNVDLLHGRVEIRMEITGANAKKVADDLIGRGCFFNHDLAALNSIKDFVQPLRAHTEKLSAWAKQTKSELEAVKGDIQKELDETRAHIAKNLNAPQLELWLGHITSVPEARGLQTKLTSESKAAIEDVKSKWENTVLSPLMDTKQDIDARVKQAEEAVTGFMGVLESARLKGVPVHLADGDKWVIASVGFTISAQAVQAARYEVDAARQEFSKATAEVSSRVETAAASAIQLAKKEKYDDARASITGAVEQAEQTYTDGLNVLRGHLAKAELELAKLQFQRDSLELEQLSASKRAQAKDLTKKAQEWNAKIAEENRDAKTAERRLAEAVIAQAKVAAKAAELRLRAEEMRYTQAYARCRSIGIDPTDRTRAFDGRSPLMVSLGLRDAAIPPRDVPGRVRNLQRARESLSAWSHFAESMQGHRTVESLGKELDQTLRLKLCERVACEDTEFAMKSVAAGILEDATESQRTTLTDFSTRLECASNGSKRTRGTFNWLGLEGSPRAPELSDVEERARFTALPPDVRVTMKSNGGYAVIGMVQIEVGNPGDPRERRRGTTWPKATERALFDVRDFGVTLPASGEGRAGLVAEDLWFVVEPPAAGGLPTDRYFVSGLDQARNAIVSRTSQCDAADFGFSDSSRRLSDNLKRGLPVVVSQYLYPGEGTWRVWLYTRTPCEISEARRTMNDVMILHVPTVGMNSK